MSQNQEYDFAVAGMQTIQNYVYEVTKSSIYLRPLIGVKYKEDFSNAGFFNNYIYDNCIYTVLVNKDVSSKDIKEDSVESLALAINYADTFRDYSANDVFQFFISTIPEGYMDDFVKVCNTKYSRTSTPFKQLLSSFYTKNPRVSLYVSRRLDPTINDFKEISRKFNVSIDLVKESGEVESYFDLTKETFDRDLFEPNGTIYEYIKSGGKY